MSIPQLNKNSTTQDHHVHLREGVTDSSVISTYRRKSGYDESANHNAPVIPYYYEHQGDKVISIYKEGLGIIHQEYEFNTQRLTLSEYNHNGDELRSATVFRINPIDASKINSFTSFDRLIESLGDITPAVSRREQNLRREDNISFAALFTLPTLIFSAASFVIMYLYFMSQ